MGKQIADGDSGKLGKVGKFYEHDELGEFV